MTVLALARTRPWTEWARVIVTELAIVLGGVAAYAWVAARAAERSGVALGNARTLLAIEHALCIDVERPANGWWAASDPRVLAANLYYLLPHFVVPFVVFGLLVIFRPAAYRPFRTAFVLASLIGVLVSWAWPTAPPRLVGGYHDTLAAAPVAGFGGPAGMSGAENPFAAFPSMHVGWAVWTALAVAALTRRRWIRSLAWLHAGLTAADIVLTGNHWLVDALAGAAVALLAAALSGCFGALARRSVGPGPSGGPGRRKNEGVCSEPGESGVSGPREVVGPAVDPIALPEVDEVRVTTLVDNAFDGLLASEGRVGRPPMGAGVLPAPQFEGGATPAGLVAEHGFSALVSIGSTTLLFDTGVSPEGMATNLERLGLGVGELQGVVLSHGHFDHTGGFPGLVRLRGRQGLPLTVHPAVWTRRRLAVPGDEPRELPTLSARALAGEGFEVIERRVPSLLVEGKVLITGEVDRTTGFERGMPPAHQAWDGHEWRHDPTVVDDQALVVNVRGRGLVIVTGCGHAGIVNIARHAMRLTGVDRVHAIIGGFHLSGPAFEPIIAPTVAALADLAPSLLVPGHCTGWRAQHALAATLPDAWVQSSSGTTYTLAA